MAVTVYCSGSIQKGNSDISKKLYWTDTERGLLARAAHPLEVHFLNPDDPSSDLNNTAALFGRDMYQIQFADFVVVDARERRGIGIGIEIVVSRVVGTPLIIVAPRNSYYRQENLSYRGSTVKDYIHPHLALLADVVVDDFEEAGKWMCQFVENPTHFKNVGIIHEAIDAYESQMLPNDPPMLEILQVLGQQRDAKS